MNSIFFTGGHGFIGKNFREYFVEKYSIDAPTRLELDLLDAKKVNHYFENKTYDYIIHGASVNTSRKNQTESHIAFNENTRCFANIYKHRKICDRFIFISSGAAYSLPLSVKRIDESYFEEIIPEDGYGFSKFVCSRMMEGESSQKAVSLQLFGIFGYHEDYQTKFISNSIYRALQKLPIIVNNPNIEFDYLYVKDCARIIEHFLKVPSHHSLYNVASGQAVKLIEVAEIIKDIIGEEVELNINNGGDSISYTANNRRLMEFLGDDFRFTPFRSAIEEMVMWYDKNLVFLNENIFNT